LDIFKSADSPAAIFGFQEADYISIYAFGGQAIFGCYSSLTKKYNIIWYDCQYLFGLFFVFVAYLLYYMHYLYL